MRGAGTRTARGAAWLALAALGGCAPPAEAPPSLRAEEPASVRGVLRVSAYGDPRTSALPTLVHRTVWRRDAHYDGMEDVDLRGFLDGLFLYGWNQPGQIHVRLGRRPTRPRVGETELFRDVQRWADIALPVGAEVREAGLTLHVEAGAGRDLVLALYALNKPFEPGGGGTRRDNSSPPLPGEVWWGAAAEGERPWGLPGAGFADDEHPDADTPTQPLAEAALAADAEHVTLASPELAAYAESRATRGEPLRFLLKLTDVEEDAPGTLLYLYSADVGVPEAPGRRPSLALAWEAPGDLLAIERPIHLEWGRVLELGRYRVGGARSVAASFEPEPRFESPTLLARGGRDGEPGGAWLPLDGPGPVGAWDWLELRVVAARDPLVLGEPFETGFRDTWVRTAPPEAQRVGFEFVSPSGEHHDVVATYTGDYRWSVRFVPDEIGRWCFRFRQTFLEQPFESEPGCFDVVVLDRASARRALLALLERVRRETPNSRDTDPNPLRPRFWKLERAALALETPDHLTTEEGASLLQLLIEVREALSTRRIPKKLVPTPMDREF